MQIHITNILANRTSIRVHFSGARTYLILVLSFLLIHTSIFAQPGSYDPEKVYKKAAELYEKALHVAEQGNYKEGIAILYNAVKQDGRFADAYLSIAGMYGEMKQYDSAISNYEAAKAIDSLYFQDYNLPYSINLAGKGHFEKA